MKKLRTIGVDPSLTSTGVAYPDGTTESIRWPGNGIHRLAAAFKWARSIGDVAELVVIEGYAFAARNSRAHALGELGGVLRLGFADAEVRVLEIPPTTLKKYATGKGNASKELVLVDAVKRLAYCGSSNDEADALWLRQIGLAVSGQPSVPIPASHRSALDKLTTP